MISILVCEPQPIVSRGTAKGARRVNHLIWCLQAPYRNRPTRWTLLSAFTRTSLSQLTEAQDSPPLCRLLANLKSAGNQLTPVLWVLDCRKVDAFRALQMGARGIVKKSVWRQIHLLDLSARGGARANLDAGIRARSRLSPARKDASTFYDTTGKGSCAA